MSVMATEKPIPPPLPVALRIDLAEAFIELTWAGIPTPRTGLIEYARWRVVWAEKLETIDLMLDKLLLMYLERDGITIPDHAEGAA